MNVILVLAFILFFLMEEIGGKQGVKAFFSMIFNVAVLYLGINLMVDHYDPFLITMITSVIISCVLLFFNNNINRKTIAAFVSVFITLLFMIFIMDKMGEISKIQGFGEEEFDEISSYSLYIGIDFTKLLGCTMIMGLLGAVIDMAISIASPMNEFYKNKKALTKKELFNMGMNVGRDILGTMTNTIYFAFLAGYLALIIWFKDLSYSLGAIMNSKVFCAEIIQVICSSLGATLIIPISAAVTTYILFLDCKPLRPTIFSRKLNQNGDSTDSTN